MSIMQPRIYLASQSPRRRELLKQIGIRFELLLLRTDSRRHADVDEAPYPGEAPEVYVQRLSRGKAQVGFDALQLRHLPPHPVLAADTTVTLDGKIFGKPHHADQAATMLRELSGREHQVLTAVAIAMGSHIEYCFQAPRCVLPNSAKRASIAICKPTNTLTRPAVTPFRARLAHSSNTSMAAIPA
jgi:septum formation protein